MTTLYVAIGLPGCGKTTEGERWLDAEPTKRALVSRDDIRHLALRRDRTGIKALATEENPNGHDDAEALVTHMQSWLLSVALSAGRDVYVHDTNLVPEHRDKIAGFARTHYRAEIRYVDFTGVPLYTCMARNARRERPVPSEVIERMYDEWIVTGAALEGVPAGAIISWGEFRQHAARR